MHKRRIANGLKILVGSAVYALGIDLFLEPSGLNPGGITGLSMILIHVFGVGTVGSITVLINLPLFIIGRRNVGKRFFYKSLIGLAFASVFVDLFTLFPTPRVEPLLAALYGGALTGLGMGMLFSTGGSSGGTDIIARLLKKKFRDVPIGVIISCADLAITLLAGLVFRDISKTLYSIIAIFVIGKVVDAVVYSFDYSKVVMIITQESDAIANAIGKRLDRGATFLHGEGSYRHQPTKVVLTAVSRRQVTELKELSNEIDPSAFLIVQEAHQVLGDGFRRYSKEDSL